jgi:phage terminase large subunit GpA-like protein
VGLCGELTGRRYVQDMTGAEIRCERMLIDSGFETKAVYDFVRQLNAPGMIVLPSKGFGRSTTQVGIGGWKPRPGEQRGYHWRKGVSETGKGQSVQYDTDAWKSFVYERLTMPQGGPGCITLFGKDHRQHSLLSEHLSSEYSEPATLRGTTFDKWSVLPDRGENHWFDCLVGNAVTASVAGLQWSASDTAAAKDVPVRIRFAEQQKRARDARRGKGI